MPRTRTGKRPIPCLGCGRLSLTSRCPACAPTYDRQWEAISLAARQAQPWCSVPGCTNRRLEVDHIDPRDLSAGVQVLCTEHHHDKTAGQRGRGGSITSPSRPASTPIPDANAFERRTP
jgi:hypothetical protein